MAYWSIIRKGTTGLGHNFSPILHYSSTPDPLWLSVINMYFNNTREILRKNTFEVTPCPPVPVESTAMFAN